MKTIPQTMLAFLLISLLAYSSSLVAQNDAGIQFFEGSFDEALAQAKKENKQVFLDAYTSWCGPCKKMMKEIFPKAEVGAVYNKNFIAIKVDMEKGEGPTLAEKFDISRYPTYMYLNANGKPLHRAIGYMPAEAFIKRGNNALNPSKQYYTLKEQYEAGNVNKKVSYNYAMAAVEAGMRDDAQNAANSYLKTQNARKLTKAKNMDFIMKTTFDDGAKGFEVFADNLPAFEKKYGDEKVAAKFTQILNRKVYLAAQNEDENALEAAMKMVKKYKSAEEADKVNTSLMMLYFEKLENWPKYAKVAARYAKNYASDDWSALNSIAWTFFEHIDNDNALMDAISWAKQSMMLKTNYYNADTYANLLYKVGNKEAAMRAAKTAIKAAAAEDINASETIEMVLNSFCVKSNCEPMNMATDLKTAFIKSLGEEKYYYKVGKMANKRAIYAGETGDKNLLTTVQASCKKAFGKNSKHMGAQLELSYLKGASDWNAYADKAGDYVTEYAEKDWFMLNNIAWNYYENIDNQTQLKAALSWAKQSMGIETNYYNTDTYAALLYKTGDVKSAMATAKKAIALAKDADIDPQETQKLLEKMKNM